MNSRTNYTLVGFFVLTSIVMIFVFVVWLIKPTDEKVLSTYIINFSESVSGLNVDSPVKYRGVTIGKVTKMGINLKNTEEIKVYIKVDKDAPIKTDTVAKLKSQGITGLNYIDLSQGSQDSELLCEEGDEREHIIKSVPSFLVKVEESFGSVSVNLSKTLHETGVLLREENQVEITKTLKYMANVMEKIDRALDEKSIDDYHALLASLRRSSEQLEKSLPKVDQTLDETIIFEKKVAESLQTVARSYETIASSMAVWEARNKNGDYSIKESTAGPMKQFGITMREMQTTLDEINALLARYSDSPGNMFLQSESPDIGPGERK